MFQKIVVFQEIDAITNAISDSCEPTIIPDVYLQNINGKTVIVAEIRAGRQKPYYIKSGWFGKWCVYSCVWHYSIQLIVRCLKRIVL